MKFSTSNRLLHTLLKRATHIQKKAYLLTRDQRQGKKLYRLVDTANDWPAVISKIKKYPKAATWRNEAQWLCVRDGETVLHAACRHCAPQEVLQALLEVYPRAASLRAKSGQTPLHHVCSTDIISISAVKLLLDADGSCAANPDKFGRTPLHAACSRNAPLEVVSLLLHADRSAGMVQDSMGCTPLHYACSRGSSSWVIHLLLEANGGKAAMLMNKNKCLALHYACYRRVPDGVLRLLIEANPRAVFIPHITSYLGYFEEMTPLVMLWKRYTVHPEQERVLDTSDRLSQLLLTADNMAPFRGGDLRTFWNEAILLLSAAHRGNNAVDLSRLDETMQIIHAVSAVKGSAVPPICPQQMVELIERMFTTLIYDEKIKAVVAKEEGRNYRRDHLINLAVSSGMKWEQGLHQIWKADPDVLYYLSAAADGNGKRKRRGMYPFMSAASENAEVDTIYNMLRRTPDLVC